MGTRGPIPQREDQTVRRNIPDVPVTKVSVIGTVPVPDLKIDNPHPIVVAMYESLRESGQAKYYEPSDWTFAWLTMNELNEYLQGKRSAIMLATLDSMLTKLMMTEGDRRRNRMEVERNPDAGIGEKMPDVAYLFHQRLTAVPNT